jgi:hypothetical protein
VETDLPLYYWPSRVHDGAKLADYGFFLNHSKRIVIDTAVENSSVPEFAWPRPENLSDLAEARILQVRQSLGQFLSTFDPALLVERLEKVSVTAAPALAAETGYMLDWTLNNLSTCGQRAGLAGEGAVRSEKNLDGGEESIRMEWFYGDQKAFSWAVDFASGRARIKATFKGEPIRRDSIVRLLGPEQALGEALFF